MFPKNTYVNGGVCAVYGCNNYKRQKDVKSFYRMPKNIDCLKKWIVACKRSDLDELMKLKDAKYFYKTYVVCSDHFEVECFRNKNLLSQGSLVMETCTSVETTKVKKEKKSREEILAEKRKASKERYARIKSDTILTKIQKEKDKLNYLKKKEQKQVISINQRNSNDQKIQREKWRKNSQTYYRCKKKKRDVNIDDCMDDDFTEKPLLPDYADPLQHKLSKTVSTCTSNDDNEKVKHKKSEQATSTRENDGKSSKFPPCDECKKSLDARELYRCVQCPLVVMCADCGRSNAHAHHCVLRMPSLEIYNKVEYLLESLTEVFHKELSKEEVDDDTNDDSDDVDNDNDTDDDDKEAEMKQELEISVNQEEDSEDQNMLVETAIPVLSKQRKSSASTFLSSCRDVIFASEPPDEAILTSHIKTEPDTDPLAGPPLFNAQHTRADEPNTKKRRTIMEKAPKKDYAKEVNTDKIVDNRTKEEHEEVVEVKLETIDNDAAFLDTEKYASYGSHRAGNTDF